MKFYHHDTTNGYSQRSCSDTDVDGRGEMVCVVSASFLPQELPSDYFSVSEIFLEENNDTM